MNAPALLADEVSEKQIIACKTYEEMVAWMKIIGNYTTGAEEFERQMAEEEERRRLEQEKEDAEEAARELKEEVLEKLKHGHTPDQIRDAIDFASTGDQVRLRNG